MARRKTPREFAIIGLDSLGENLALALMEQGHEAVGIDRDPLTVQRLADNIQDIMAVDATDEEALAALGIDAFETVIVAIGGDLAQAVLVTLTLKDMGVKRVVCEAQSEHDRRVLLRVGADEVITPAIESARAIAASLTGQAAVAQHLRFANQVAIKWRPPLAFNGTLGELMAPYGDEVQVFMLSGRSVIYNPGPEELVTWGEELLVAGPEEAILKLRQRAKGDG